MCPQQGWTWQYQQTVQLQQTIQHIKVHMSTKSIIASTPMCGSSKIHEYHFNKPVCTYVHSDYPSSVEMEWVVVASTVEDE